MLDQREGLPPSPLNRPHRCRAVSGALQEGADLVRDLEGLRRVPRAGRDLWRAGQYQFLGKLPDRDLQGPGALPEGLGCLGGEAKLDEFHRALAPGPAATLPSSGTWVLCCDHGSPPAFILPSRVRGIKNVFACVNFR
jgi:hypothetical protein